MTACTGSDSSRSRSRPRAKQGGILLDFERQVSGQPTKTVERFGPFLERAWE